MKMKQVNSDPSDRETHFDRRARRIKSRGPSDSGTAAHIVGVLCAAAALAAAPAQAVTVSCGQVLIDDTIIENDLLDCPGDGLRIGEHNVTVNLNGHVIDGVGAGAGVLNAGYRRITITNGVIQQFSYGIRLDPGTVRNDVAALTISDNARAGVQLTGTRTSQVRNNVITGTIKHGIVLLQDSNTNAVVENVLNDNKENGVVLHNSTHNRLESNVVSLSGKDAFSFTRAGSNQVVSNRVEQNQGGISVQPLSDRVLIRGNTLLLNETGIVIHESAGSRITDNIVQDSLTPAISIKNASSIRVNRNDLSFSKGGIKVELSAHSLIDQNNVSRTNDTGIELLASRGIGVLFNTVNANAGSGIVVKGAAAVGSGVLLNGNTADFNGVDGIRVEGSGHMIQNNVARGNLAVGIFAASDNIEGGGNSVRGNGELEQCVGVPSCAPDLLPEPVSLLAPAP